MRAIDGPGQRCAEGRPFLMPGWNQLMGAAYERRIDVFRFETTPEQRTTP